LLFSKIEKKKKGRGWKKRKNSQRKKKREKQPEAFPNADMPWWPCHAGFP
jgi:stalled ribosome alternative rescue factor ArfA